MDELARLPAVEMDEEPAFDAELLAALPSRLAALPTASRTVLRLHYLESLTQQEIAEALEIPLGTVKSRIGYGLQLLRATVHR